MGLLIGVDIRKIFVNKKRLVFTTKRLFYAAIFLYN